MWTINKLQYNIVNWECMLTAQGPDMATDNGLYHHEQLLERRVLLYNYMKHSDHNDTFH